MARAGQGLSGPGRDLGRGLRTFRLDQEARVRCLRGGLGGGGPGARAYYREEFLTDGVADPPLCR